VRVVWIINALCLFRSSIWIGLIKRVWNFNFTDRKNILSCSAKLHNIFVIMKFEPLLFKILVHEFMQINVNSPKDSDEVRILFTLQLDLYCHIVVCDRSGVIEFSLMRFDVKIKWLNIGSSNSTCSSILHF
jgi:hypothetical protein